MMTASLLNGLMRTTAIHMFGGLTLAALMLLESTFSSILGIYGGGLMYISLRFYFPELTLKYGVIMIGAWTIGVAFSLLGGVMCMGAITVLLVATATHRFSADRLLLTMGLAFGASYVLMHFSFEQGNYLLVDFNDDAATIAQSLRSGAFTGIGVGVLVHSLVLLLRTGRRSDDSAKKGAHAPAFTSEIRSSYSP